MDEFLNTNICEDDESFVKIIEESKQRYMEKVGCLHYDFSLNLLGYPAPAAAGAAPPKNQGNREARSAIYATAGVPIFDHVFFCFS